LKKIIRLPKKTILTVLILCGLAVSIPYTVKAYNNHNYNSYLVKGQDCLSDENYEEAVTNFDNALKYNKNETDEINKLIDRAVMLNLSMHSFEEGAKLFYDKEYEKAIPAFEKVILEDNLRHDVAQEKIKECKNALSASNIAAAKNEALSLNYDKAIAYLNAVLKVDPQNQEAISLKNDYTSKLITIVVK
jgi:tetratricopeptide (TPR) repeat protein